MNCKIMSRALLLTGILFMMSSCGHEAKEDSATRGAVRVKTMTVSESGVGETFTYSGTVEEENATVVSFSAAGTIKTLTVSEGDKVTKGQLIGTLDDGTLRNAYDIANATLEQARDAYNRMKLLHDSNSLPEIKWVDVQSKLKQAESAAEIARIALDDAKLYAPVTGVVAEKMASAGQTTAPGLPVVKLVDIKDVKVVISIPENDISKFSTGAKATIRSKSTGEESYAGELVEKGIVANPLSRSYQVKYLVNNAGGRLLPGMICEVEVEKSSDTKGVILPTGAVLLSADNTQFVWLDSAGTAVKRVVCPGAMLPEGIAIESGLSAGEKVIVAGMEKVSRGTEVTSIN